MDTTVSFGYWVRRRRKALDLTQEELALGVGCAVVSLRKIEADERRPSRAMAERLAHCLAVPAAERQQFIAAAVGEKAAVRLPLPTEPAGRLRSNLPAPVTSLVGRDAELAAISDCLRRREARLLTLTGPVGVGKTRLAIEAGRRLFTEFRDGICLVALAAVQDATLAPAATAATLGVRETRARDLARSVRDFLAPKEMLLIFDNFEHLLPAAAFLSELLAACPGLHVMVTSRAPLHLYGEHEYAVTPLLLPDGNAQAGAVDSPAVRLFCERAQAVQADFRLTPDLASVVIEICRRLDGLPLAIELAASRLKLFSPQELQRRLDHGLPLLAQGGADLPPRMKGLENAISWSYGLLAPEQRTLLARLSVFAGGFTLPAAEAVCAFPFSEQVFSTGHTASLPLPDVVQGIDALLDQSLVYRETTSSRRHAAVSSSCASCPRRRLCAAAQSESRFSMLETIREFARARLQANAELEVMQRCYAGYFAAWAEHATAHLYGPDQAIWLERLEAETGNLRAALAWLLAAGDVTTAAGLACALGEFWQRHGHYSEGRAWLQQALAQMAQTPVCDDVRARTLQTAATLAYRQGDWQTAQQWLSESLAVFRALSDQSGIARVLFDLGWIALDREEWWEAARLNQESLTIARDVDDPCAIYRALTNLGWARLCCGERDAAAALFDEAYRQAERSGHTRGLAVSLANMGWIALQREDVARSISLTQESLRLCHLLGEREVLAECMEILALAAVAAGDGPRAAQLREGAEALWEALHVTRPPIQHLRATDQGANAARSEFAETSLAGVWRQGKTMGLDALVALALGCGQTSASGTGAAGGLAAPVSAL